MCNENLDLVELLGNCSEGIKLYSPIVGEIVFVEIDKSRHPYPIRCRYTAHEFIAFTSEGKYFNENKNGECLLFPSKENRDWSTFCVYEDGDFLASEDGRAFIFRGKFSKSGYPMAYGGIDTCDDFISSEDNKAWYNTSFRFATTDEIHILQTKMTEAGYMWDADQKVLRKDLPIDTLVAVCDKYHENIFIHELAIRRYAGNSRCCIYQGGSKWYSDNTMAWKHIVPLDKLTVNVDGTLNLENVIDYGTHAHNC